MGVDLGWAWVACGNETGSQAPGKKSQLVSLPGGLPGFRAPGRPGGSWGWRPHPQSGQARGLGACQLVTWLAVHTGALMSISC